MNIELLIDSFFKIIIPGIQITIPLTIISFSIALVIAILTAIVQVANMPVLKQLARIYVWFIRGTPLVVQLFIVFFGLPYFNIMLIIPLKTDYVNHFIVFFNISRILCEKSRFIKIFLKKIKKSIDK